MFQTILSNILKRYSLQDLSIRYGVNLPDPHVNAVLVKKANSQTAINGNYYELSNKNKFAKQSGEIASATLLNEDKAIVFKGRLGFLARLIAWLMSFVHEFMQKITDFFTNLLPKVPENFKKIAEILITVIITLLSVPFMILGIIMNVFQMITKSRGGAAGMLLGIFTALLFFIFQIFMLLLGLIISPFVNKVVDSMLDTPYIKKMVIGYFTLQNNFNGTIVLSNNMVSTTRYEVRKNLLGSEKLYVVIQEGDEQASLADKYFWSFLIPYYFVNRQTVFVTNIENQHYFENIYN